MNEPLPRTQCHVSRWPHLATLAERERERETRLAAAMHATRRRLARLLLVMMMT